MHERDRQTDHGTVTSIATGEIACQRCRLKASHEITESQVIKKQQLPQSWCPETEIQISKYKQLGKY